MSIPTHWPTMLNHEYYHIPMPVMLIHDLTILSLQKTESLLPNKSSEKVSQLKAHHCQGTETFINKKSIPLKLEANQAMYEARQTSFIESNWCYLQRCHTHSATAVTHFFPHCYVQPVCIARRLGVITFFTFTILNLQYFDFRTKQLSAVIKTRHRQCMSQHIHE